jgi:large repetitive protein
MRSRAGLTAGAIATALGVLGAFGAAPAVADQVPPGCSSNSLDLTVTKDRTLVRNGDRTNYTVIVANQGLGACNLTGVTVTLTLPAANGTSTGETVTLASNVDYPAGTAPIVLGVVPYTVALDPGVTDAIAEARAAGTLHDAPIDHAAQIIKTLGTTVTQPHLTLTETAAPTEGQAPLPTTITYTLTNDSSTNAPIASPSVSDEVCAPITFTGGDANANGVLDVGESWTYNCAATLRTAGVVTSTATATGTNTIDNLPVQAAPSSASITVTAPPRSVVLGRKLVSPRSRSARRNAACIALPRRLSIRARERTLVRVRVREDGLAVERALVRVIGPGVRKRKVTNARGVATFRVRAKQRGTLVIQSDRCGGADRVRVLRARRVSNNQVPRGTG